MNHLMVRGESREVLERMSDQEFARHCAAGLISGPRHVRQAPATCCPRCASVRELAGPEEIVTKNLAQLDRAGQRRKED